MSKEIVTLSFGRVANYTCSHLWNFQDELLGLEQQDETWAGVDASALFRFTEDAQGHGACYPRCLMVDSSGGLGGLPAADTEDPEDEAGLVAVWGERMQVVRQQPVPRSDFVQQLDLEAEEEEEAMPDEDAPAETLPNGNPEPGEDQAQDTALQEAARRLDRPGGPPYWTDFLKTALAPGSTLVLPHVWGSAPLGDPSGPPQAAQGGFGGPAGLSGQVLEELEDRVRKLLEDCDRLQGFHVMVDDLGPFGEVARASLAAVAEEHGRVPRLLFALRDRPGRPSPLPDPNAEGFSLRSFQLSSALSLAQLAPLASLYCPLTPPQRSARHLSWASGNAFHVSAIAAAAIDSACMPWRQAGPAIGANDLHSVVQLLAHQPAANVVLASMACPCPGLPDTPSEAQDERSAQHQAPESDDAEPSFTSTCLQLQAGVSADEVQKYLLAESVMLRGARQRGRQVSPAQASEALDASLLAAGRHGVRHRCVIPQPLPIPLPYPQRFPAGTSRHGDLPDALQPAQQLLNQPWGNQQGAQLVGQAPSAPPRPRQSEVISTPVLTRLAASTVSAQLPQAALAAFRGAHGSAAGRALWRAWDKDLGEAEEVCEALVAAADAFESDGDDY